QVLLQFGEARPEVPDLHADGLAVQRSLLVLRRAGPAAGAGRPLRGRLRDGLPARVPLEDVVRGPVDQDQFHARGVEGVGDGLVLGGRLRDRRDHRQRRPLGREALHLAGEGLDGHRQAAVAQLGQQRRHVLAQLQVHHAGLLLAQPAGHREGGRGGVVADGEDLQRFADRAVHVVDHAEEDVLQAVRPAGERGGGLVQLAAQCGERAAGRGDGVRGRGGRAPPGGALRGAAHDSVAIASRPPSRNSGHEPPSSLPRGSTTPCRYLLRIARSSGSRRAREPTSEAARVRAVRVRSPKKLLCRMASSSTPICSAVDRADSSFSSSLPAAAAEARRSAKLWSSTSSRVGGTSSSIEWRRSSSSVRKRTISVSLFLLVMTGMRTKLNRRFSAEDRSLTPRSRLLAVAMTEKPGLAKTMLSLPPLSSSGTEMYFSERMEISASWTSLVERVSSSKRPIAPVSIAVMMGEGIIDSRDWPLAMTMETFHEYLMWSSVVPAVPCTTRVELRLIAADSS